MMYGCESWPIKKDNEDTLMRAERRMIRMMCGVTLANRENSKDLLERIGLVDYIVVGVKKARLGWFGHSQSQPIPMRMMYSALCT